MATVLNHAASHIFAQRLDGVVDIRRTTNIAAQVQDGNLDPCLRKVRVLLHVFEDGSIVSGVDLSQEMVRQAAARNSDALRSRRADLRYGSVERLPSADETFDKALAINSMQAWPDARAGLREIRRVLKHGGNVARLHRQLRSAKGGRYGVARRCWLCAGANREQVEALLRDCDKAVMRRNASPSSSASGPLSPSPAFCRTGSFRSVGRRTFESGQVFPLLKADRPSMAMRHHRRG
jgi:SAM-dependent methyltransferase